MLLAVIILTSGIIFFWLSWGLWIIITFFMTKNKKRTRLACWVLLSIICSNLYIAIDGFQLSITLLLLISGSLLMLVQQPRIIYHLFAAFTITIGYVAMLLWEINAPVWIIFSRIITISVLLGILSLFLAKNFYNRLGICLFGTSFGELLYHLILSGYDLQAAAGDFLFLDCILFAVAILVILKLLKMGKYKLYNNLQHYNNAWRHPIRKFRH